MPTKDEQVCPGQTPVQRKTMKRRKVRKDRRAAKKDPENAPKKRGYQGWGR